MDCDLIQKEFKTNENTLSFWLCDNFSNVNETIKAILLSTTSIKTSIFIVLKIEDITINQLSIDSTIGKTGYKGLENTHYNIIQLNYAKLGTLLELFRISSKDDSGLFFKIEKSNVKALIKEVVDAGRLDTSKLDDHLIKDINKYLDTAFPLNET